MTNGISWWTTVTTKKNHRTENWLDTGRIKSGFWERKLGRLSRWGCFITETNTRKSRWKENWLCDGGGGRGVGIDCATGRYWRRWRRRRGKGEGENWKLSLTKDGLSRVPRVARTTAHKHGIWKKTMNRNCLRWHMRMAGHGDASIWKITRNPHSPTQFLNDTPFKVVNDQ